MTDYKAFFTAVIQRELRLLGEEKTFNAVLKIQGLQVNEQGNVLSYKGDERTILRKLSDSFSAYSNLARIPLRAIILEFRNLNADFKLRYDDLYSSTKQ
ncbi:MAG: hypothetical protein ABH952_01565 [Candidatus Omnitrophota bacterium]